MAPGHRQKAHFWTAGRAFYAAISILLSFLGPFLDFTQKQIFLNSIAFCIKIANGKSEFQARIGPKNGPRLLGLPPDVHQMLCGLHSGEPPAAWSPFATFFSFFAPFSVECFSVSFKGKNIKIPMLFVLKWHMPNRSFKPESLRNLGKNLFLLPPDAHQMLCGLHFGESPPFFHFFSLFASL